ncbi:hypothetical protein ACHAPT_003376 [Fusarium lateritium]
MSYRSFHGQGQQGQQQQQPLPTPGMNSSPSYVGGGGAGGYQQFTSPQQQQQQQQQFYSMPQQQQGQQSYMPTQAQQQMAQFGGMPAAYQGYETNSQAFGGHQMQPAAAHYVPPPNVWQQQQQSPGGQGMMFQQQFQQSHHQQQMYQRPVASPQQQQRFQQQSQVPSPRQRTPSIPQSQGYRLPQPQQQTQQYSQQQQHLPQQQHQQYQHQQQQQRHTHAQQQAQVPVSQPSPQPVQKQTQPQIQQQRQQPVQQPPPQSFQQQQPPQAAQRPIQETAPEPAPEPVQQHHQPPQPEPQQMHYVNLQDIQQLPPSLPPVTMGMANSTTHEPIHTQPLQQDTITVKPMDVMLGSPQSQHLPPPQPQQQPSSHQQKAGAATPRIKPSPLSSVTNSPALTARSPSITKKSPATTPKARPPDTVHMMVAVAEECFDKARAAVHDVAMSLNATRIDEYQKLISTGLACLEASLQRGRLSPRQEARMRLRYAAVLLEETENLMEAETSLSKGIPLCEKHRMFDLKYCMQYIQLKLLFQRSHKAALTAVDRHISDCEAFKHVHWVYAFRLLKASFYMEVGQTADASALENIRSIQVLANSRGDNALSVFASILEGLTLLKASKDGNIEKVQQCIAQVAKFQFDPSVHIMQLDMLTLLLDLASSINHQSPDVTLQKLRLVQKRLDECSDWHNVKSDFLVPVKKQPSTANTISSDTAAIIRHGDGAPVDFLVLSFMTKMELTSLVFTFSGLANLHKPSPHGRRFADFWREGLRILDSWDDTTIGIRYGPSVSLQVAIQQREWRLEAQAYLNILLGLYAASHCQWDTVEQFLVKLETLITPSTQGILKLLAMYLSGVYRQGTGDLQTALDIFRGPSFDIAQRGTGVKAAHRELAMLAGLNRLWIMQHPSQRDDQETLELMEQLQPLCSSHHNVDLRTAWHNVMAAISTEPPQQLNQQKQHIQAAMGGSKSTNNVLGAAVTLAIMRNRLFENVIGEQALKSAMAAAKQAQRSGNVLWQSVADGMLAQSYEVQGQREEAAREWEKATREAGEAFSER